MYTKKSLLQKLLCFAAAVCFVIAAVFMSISSARAQEQAFAGEAYGENWEISDPDSTRISYSTDDVIYGKGTNNSTWSVLRYDPVTLDEGESIAIEFTVSNSHGMNIITSFNETSDYTAGMAAPWGGVSHWVFPQAGQPLLDNQYSKEKVSIIYSGTDYSSKITKGGENATADFKENSIPGENLWSEWQASGTTLEPYENRLVTFRVVYGADGSSILYARMSEDSSWAVIYVVQSGIGGTAEGDAVAPDSGTKDFDSVAFTDKTGKECYPAIAIQYAAWMNVYDYELTEISVTVIGADKTVKNADYGADNWEPYQNDYNFTFQSSKYEMESSTDWSVFRMNDAVTLAEGEKLEMIFSVSQAGGTYIMPSFNSVEVWEEYANLRPYGGMRFNFPVGNGIGVNNIYWDYNIDGTPEYTPDIISGAITGLTHVLPGENNTGDGKDAFIIQDSKFNENGSMSANWTAASTTLNGFAYAKPLMIKAVFYADGSMYYYARLAGDADWSTLCFIKPNVKVIDDFYADNPDAGAYGIKAGEGLPVDDTDDRWSEANGDYITTGGPVLTGVAAYPAIAIVNSASVSAHELSNTFVYKIDANGNRTSIASTWQFFAANGENDRITETVSEVALTIDNASAGDVLVSKQPLKVSSGAVDNALTVSMDVSAQDITGTGMGVIYLSDSKTDFANAAKIYFDIDGMGVVNGEEVIPEYALTFASGEFKTLRIESSVAGVNQVYVNDQLAATFNLDLDGKYIAFGAEISSLNSAVLRVQNFSLTEHKAAETDGAAIRIVEGEAGSMRFISSFSKEEIASLGADSYKIGTVIKGGVYTGDELTVETAGALKIENGAGYWKETTEEYVISAYIYGIDQAHYATEVSARAYIEYVKDGETHYIYGDVISRSLSEVAESALNDVSDVQDEVYQYDLGNGTFSPYDEATRAILQTYKSEI